jgi:guanylate kinase
VLEIELQGARQVRERRPDSIRVFVAPPDPAALRRRLEGRGTDDRKAIERRLETAREELAAEGEFEHVVVNDEVERAASELERIVRRELDSDG